MYIQPGFLKLNILLSLLQYLSCHNIDLKSIIKSNPTLFDIQSKRELTYNRETDTIMIHNDPFTKYNIKAYLITLPKQSLVYIFVR